VHEYVAAVFVVLEGCVGAVEPRGAVLVPQPRDRLATAAARSVNAGCLPPPLARPAACCGASIVDQQAPANGGNQEI